MRVLVNSRSRLRPWAITSAVLLTTEILSSCAPVQPVGSRPTARLEQMVNLVDEVKSFGKTLGIQPTEALSRNAAPGSALSMLWLWMQRAGTLALQSPIDIRMAIGFNTEKERLKIEQVYRVEGYSVYYRQGNEFADSRSVVTLGFADEPLVRRVKVILHEDLHGDANFALPWEIEEAIVTPLGSLAAVEYFRQKGDEIGWKSAAGSLMEERRLSRELITFVAQAEKIFAALPVEGAKERVLESLADYPIYRRQFDRQVEGQHAPTALEAKLSHDLAYYRYFDRLVELAEKAPTLKALIGDLKNLPKDASPPTEEKYFGALADRYSDAAK